MQIYFKKKKKKEKIVAKWAQALYPNRKQGTVLEGYHRVEK